MKNVLRRTLRNEFYCQAQIVYHKQINISMGKLIDFPCKLDIYRYSQLQGVFWQAYGLPQMQCGVVKVKPNDVIVHESAIFCKQQNRQALEFGVRWQI